MADCFYHTGRNAVTRCKQCGRPLCGECKIIKPSGIFCSEKCASAFEVFKERAEEIEAKRTAKKRLPGIVRVLFLLAILAAIYLAARRFL